MTAQSHHRILIASAAMALSTSHVTAFNHVWLPSRRPSIHHHRHPYSSPKSIATPSTRTAPSKPLSILGATMDRDATSSNSNSSDSSTLEGAEWYVKQPKDDPNVVVDIEAKREAFQRSLLAARIANDFKSGDVHVDSAGSMGDVSLSSSTATTTPISNTPFAILAAKLAKDVLSPLLDPTIAKNVPPPTIRGAALAGSFLSFLSLALFFGTWGISPFPLFESLAAAASAGLFFAYAAITEGTAGTAARTAGAWTQRAVDAAWETYREVEAGRKVDRAVRAMETIEKVSPSNQEELTPNDNDDDHVVENVLHEAQRAIRQAEEAKRALRDASLRKTEALVLASQKIDDVQKTKEELARRKREEEEKARRAEEELARKEREVQAAKEAERRRLEEWERIREKEWVEEQNRLAEERRAKRVEEEKRLIEEMRLAEQARIAEEMRLAEEAMAEAERRKEEEAARKREEERIAEETRIAAEKAEAARVMKEEQERMAAELRARAEEEARLRKLEEEKKRAAEEQEAARLAEFQRLAEEARIKEEAEQRRLEEEARIKKEKEEEERRRLEEERRLMEEEEEQRRLEEEMRIQKEKEEEERRRLEEEMRIQKEKEEEERRRLEEEARIQKEKEEEEQRRLEEVAAAAREAVRLAETEAAFMEDDDDEDGELIDDDDWEASVRLANELVGMPSSGLGNFSEDTDDDDDMDDLLQMELSELSPEEEDALGKAAREAVRKYEEEMRLAQKEKDSIRSSWDEEMVVAPVEDFDDVEAQEDDPAREEDVDYSSMTVAELKDILRSKGLKVSGKKSELIERLNSS